MSVLVLRQTFYSLSKTEMQFFFKKRSGEFNSSLSKNFQDIVKAIQQKVADGNNVMYNAAYVDNFLWLYRRKNAKQIEEMVPFHRTRCIYY